jgi:hypothetical protein
VNDRPWEGAEPDLVETWRLIENRWTRLSPRDRVAVRDAIASSVLEGHMPTPNAIEWLIAFAAEELTFEQYKQRVLATINPPHGPAEPS